MHWNRWTRKLHRWGAVLIAAPLILVIVSGLMLQVKKQVAWVQPPTRRGSSDRLNVSWDAILQKSRTDSHAGVQSWDDIDRLDVRLKDKIVKVQCKNGWELQLDFLDGSILSSSFRRSDLIESFHDGSWFGDPAKVWIFLPNGLVLLGLWMTGMYLWYLPIGARAAKKRKRSQ